MPPDNTEPDALGRGRMTQAKRIDLLERDRAQQSRMITELVDKVGKGFTPEQLAQLRMVMRDELADAGLRLDGAEYQDEAREDFRFLRRWRRAYEGTSSKIGGAILLSLIAVGGTIFGLGFWQWISKNLP